MKSINKYILVHLKWTFTKSVPFFSCKHHQYNHQSIPQDSFSPLTEPLNFFDQVMQDVRYKSTLLEILVHHPSHIQIFFDCSQFWGLVDINLVLIVILTQPHSLDFLRAIHSFQIYIINTTTFKIYNFFLPSSISLMGNK